MNTSAEKNERVDVPEGAEPSCGPTCSCNARGMSMKGKVLVCVLVALAAVAVVSFGSTNKARTQAATSQGAFAAAADPTAAPTAAPAPADPIATPAVAPAATPTTVTPAPSKPAEVTGAKPAQTAVWGSPLSSLASLNQVAADKSAVFVFLPAADGKQTEAIKAQVESAVKKSQARGSATIAYTLSRDAKEYTEVTKQAPAPCVLVMVKSAGAVPVSGEITEAKLLEALVTASRPSSCGPSGCGPSGCG